MNPSPQRAEPALPAAEPYQGAAQPYEEHPGTMFEPAAWTETRTEDRSAGGRAVLGTALALLAALWLAYTAWSAGRALADQPLSSPALAQWFSIAAGPLALLGLVWLMFGRTRRKEAERFTRSVVAMRTEAQSLETLLAVLRQRLDEEKAALSGMTESLMRLGDETSGRLSSVTRELDASSQRLTQTGQALDRTAEATRSDLGVLLHDLPQAEAAARAIGEQLRGMGDEAVSRSSELAKQIALIGERAQDSDTQLAEAARRLVDNLNQIETAGAAAAIRVQDAEASFTTALDSLLERTAASLDQIRSGIDAQSAAVSALIDQASAGIGRTGIEAADALGASVGRATTNLEALSSQVAEQERASQRLFAEVDRGLALIDQRFAELAAQGDDRANHFLSSLTRARSELDALGSEAGAQDQSIEQLARRTEALNSAIAQLSGDIQQGLAGALNEAENRAQTLLGVAQAAKPDIGWMRDAAIEASDRLTSTTTSISEQQDRLSALLAGIDDGVGGAENRLRDLAAALSGVQQDAANLSAQTGPALVAALTQVREAAAHAAARAREAIADVIPASAGELSQKTKEALEAAIREGVEERLREVETVAARAVDSARNASERLAQQMLSIGQSAAALEAHVQRTEADVRAKDSEAFGRRVALLMDSMHSAAIDVGKILSDEVDEKAWDSYLKGNRGVFTRRAVRLLDGGEGRAIRSHYDSDAEFQASVNRYVHDFEAMLRRVLAERDGGMVAVTMMSSDVGKLYAALAQAIDRRR